MIRYLLDAEDAYAEKHGCYIGSVQLAFRSLVAGVAIAAAAVTCAIMPFWWLIDLTLAATIAGLVMMVWQSRSKGSPSEEPPPGESSEPAQDAITHGHDAALPLTDAPDSSYNTELTRVLYDRHRHGKHIVKKLSELLLAGVAIFAALLLAYGAGIVDASSSRGGQLLIVALVAEATVAYLCTRAWYEWKHWRLTVTPLRVRLIKPKHYVLLLFGGRTQIPAYDSTIHVANQTWVEWAFGLKCQTASIDSKTKFDEAFHDMPDIYDPEGELERALEQAALIYASTDQTMTEKAFYDAMVRFDQRQRGQQGA